MGNLTVARSLELRGGPGKGFNDIPVIHLFEQVHTFSFLGDPHHVAFSTGTETTGFAEI